MQHEVKQQTRVSADGWTVVTCSCCIRPKVLFEYKDGQIRKACKNTNKRHVIKLTDVQ